MNDDNVTDLSTTLNRNLKIEYDIIDGVIRIYPEGWEPPFGCYIYNEENESIYSSISTNSCIIIKVGYLKSGFYTIIVEDKQERKVNIFHK